MRVRTLALTILALTIGAAPALAGQQSSSGNDATRIVIYPILVEATVFGASANTPGDGGGGGGGAVSGETDYSFNAAYMAGALVQSRRWFVEGNVTWAAVSASRVTPFATISSDIWLADVRGGPTFGKGISATVGLRRLAADFDASLTLTATPAAAPVLVNTKVGLWDPLVGIDWRRDFGSLRVDANVQGGGFGVGTDIDVSTDVHADWRVVPHVTIRVGYQAIYYKWTIRDVNVGGIQRSLVSKQSLHGPSVGIGIEF